MASIVDREAEKSETTVSKLTDAVDYEAGSIASKTIIDKKGATVAVFAFDKFQEIVEHVSPHDLIFCVFEGKAEVTVGTNSHIFEKNELILIPASTPHSISATSKFKMLLITLKE